MAALNHAAFAGLALLCAGLAWFDWRNCRVPNPVTLLLLGAGFWRNFPGDPAVWLGCLLLAAGWQAGFIGGGDAKLWMALLWWVPAGLGLEALMVFGLSWLVSGGLQVAWRRLIVRPWLGVRSPAAWRTIPFVLWLWLLG